MIDLRKTPWKAEIGNVLVGHFPDRLLAQVECDKSRFAGQGLTFVTHQIDGSRWFKDPERGWRPFVATRPAIREARARREGHFWWLDHD